MRAAGSPQFGVHKLKEVAAIEARRQRITRAVLFDLEEEIGVLRRRSEERGGGGEDATLGFGERRIR